MRQRFLYDVLIMIVLIMKITYVIISIISAYGKRNNWQADKLDKIKELKEQSLVASEVFMYLVLLIIFFPRQKAEEIRVGREEQLIFFILGLLGILHTDWKQFKLFFTNAGNAILGK